MDLLADLLSGDATRIWSAACAIGTLRDHCELERLSRHIEEIEESTRGVPLGGALRPNSAHLQFALSKLAFVARESGCLCTLYSRDDLFDPAMEESAGNVRIMSTVLAKDSYYVDHYLCECSVCGARYRVTERQYHYTWWHWARAR
jgi:hypothetical protein